MRQGQWLRVAGDWVVLIEEKEFAISGKQKGSVREETSAVSAATVMSVQNRHRKPLHPLSHHHQEVEVRREKGTSEAGVRLGRPIDSRAKTSWKVLALNYLVTVGILPNVNSTSLNRVVNSAQSARFRTGRLRNNQIKGRRRVVTKVQWQQWKMYDSWVVYDKTLSRRNLQWFYGRAQKSWDQFDEYDSQELRCVKQTSEKTKVHRWEKFQVKLPHQRSPYAVKFEDRSQEETERQERCARGDAWRLAKNIIQAQRNWQSYPLLTYRRMVSSSAIRNNIGGKTVCCRFRREHAHVEQERPQLSRIGNRKSLYKSDDWRSANKRRGNSAGQRIGFIFDSKASRRYTGRSLTRKTLRRSRI